MFKDVYVDASVTDAVTYNVMANNLVHRCFANYRLYCCMLWALRVAEEPTSIRGFEG